MTDIDLPGEAQSPRPQPDPALDEGEFAGLAITEELAVVAPNLDPDPYRRLPLEQDLLAASWPDHQLTDAESHRGLLLGMYVIDEANQRRWPEFCAMFRQDLARREAEGQENRG